MRLAGVAAAAGLFVASSMVVAAQPHRVSDARLAVSATFPDKPDYFPGEACPDIPGCTVTAWDYTTYGENGRYCTFNLSVGEFFNNDGRVFTKPGEVLEWALTQHYNPDDEILSNVNISHGSNHGREMLVRIKIDAFSGNVTYQRSYIRVVVRGNRLYSANTRCDEAVDSATQRTFMESVKF